MKMSVRQRSLALIVACFAQLGCAGIARPGPCDTSTGAPLRTFALNRAEARYDSIAVAIEAPASVCVGTPLSMRFVLRNIAGRPVTLTHTYGSFFPQFVIQDALGRWVWDTGPVPLAPGARVLATGDSLEGRGLWRLTSNRFPPIGPGSYRVLGRAWMEVKAWQETPPLTFTIEPSGKPPR